MSALPFAVREQPAEPDILIEDATSPAVTEPAIPLEPQPLSVTAAALAPLALMDVLPADFPLPVLAQFVPNIRLKQEAHDASHYALSVVVSGAEGLQRADRALSALRRSQKAIWDHFDEPARIANELHKRLTGLRGEWCEPGDLAIKTVGGRIYAEQKRLEAIAAEARRKAQEQADREAREALRREAEAAKKANAPEPIVQELQRQAETATAPPVATPVSAPSLKGSTAVMTWKVRPKGTSADVDPNPPVAKMSATQLDQVRHLLKAILEDRAPVTAIEVNYTVLNGRAKSDKNTFAIPGFEAFCEGGVRAKGTRTR